MHIAQSACYQHSLIFERILLARLMELPQVVNHMPRHQFGFRKSHGYPEQIHRLVNQVTHGFEHKLYTVGVFLDVKQAFDKVWHEGLLYKMKALLPAPYYAILRSFISHRTFDVAVRDVRSSLEEIHAGVPQGSVLGPFLYTLYTADLPSPANNTEVSPSCSWPLMPMTPPCWRLIL